jgi:hypothetical protein
MLQSALQAGLKAFWNFPGAWLISEDINDDTA